MNTEKNLNSHPAMIEIRRIEGIRKKIKTARRFKTNKFYLIDKNEDTVIIRDDLKLIDMLLEKCIQNILMKSLIDTL
jgi:hypothetical protein